MTDEEILKKIERDYPTGTVIFPITLHGRIEEVDEEVLGGEVIKRNPHGYYREHQYGYIYVQGQWAKIVKDVPKKEPTKEFKIKEGDKVFNTDFAGIVFTVMGAYINNTRITYLLSSAKFDGHTGKSVKLLWGKPADGRTNWWAHESKLSLVESSITTFENEVIKVLNPEHGAKVIEYWKNRGVDTGDYDGQMCEVNRNKCIYYGVINSCFNNFNDAEVANSKAKIITLPEDKTPLEICREKYKAGMMIKSTVGTVDTLTEKDVAGIHKDTKEWVDFIFTDHKHYALYDADKDQYAEILSERKHKFKVSDRVMYKNQKFTIVALRERSRYTIHRKDFNGHLGNNEVPQSMGHWYVDEKDLELIQPFSEITLEDEPKSLTGRWVKVIKDNCHGTSFKKGEYKQITSDNGKIFTIVNLDFTYTIYSFEEMGIELMPEGFVPLSESFTYFSLNNTDISLPDSTRIMLDGAGIQLIGDPKVTNLVDVRNNSIEIPLLKTKKTKLVNTVIDLPTIKDRLKNKFVTLKF
jgi:hypothetical protein